MPVVLYKGTNSTMALCGLSKTNAFLNSHHTETIKTVAVLCRYKKLEKNY